MYSSGFKENETPLWPLMTRRQPGAETSVVTMIFRISRIYTGPAQQGLTVSDIDIAMVEIVVPREHIYYKLPLTGWLLQFLMNAVVHSRKQLTLVDVIRGLK